MANDARMTVRLDPSTRRKVERLAAREGHDGGDALFAPEGREVLHDDRAVLRNGGRRRAGEHDRACALQQGGEHGISASRRTFWRSCAQCSSFDRVPCPIDALPATYTAQ